jgi:integrase
MKHNLTDAWLRALAPPTSGRLEVLDARTPGLMLRVTPTGAATWCVRARTRDGRQTRPKLGNWPALGIAAARKAALGALAALQGGDDPVGAKRALKRQRAALAAAQDPSKTVAGRIATWQAARIADQSSPWSPRYAAEVERVCRQAVLPALGDRPLTETSREDWTDLIRAWKTKVARPKPKPVAGERGRAGAPARDGTGATAFLYRSISSFLNYAEAQGWVGVPLLPRKGAGVIAPPPRSRDRVLTDAELAEIWKAADREPPKLRAFVRLAILTAAREAEVADATAGEVDLNTARWAIPGDRTKNGIAYTVPLCALALAELRAVWPNVVTAADYRLLGRSGDSGFRGFGRLKLRVDAAVAAARVTAGVVPAALPHWRWHDLRRTARTGMTRLGVPRDHAESALNHVSDRSALERTYDRHDYAPEVLAALARWQQHVAALVAAPGTDDTV